MNEPSDTPRTDASMLKYCRDLSLWPEVSEYCYADDARTLERELTAMTAQRDSWCDRHTIAAKERDRLREKLWQIANDRETRLQDIARAALEAVA